MEKGGDFMRKPSRKVITVVLAIVALFSLKLYGDGSKSPAPQVWTPGCVASVPKSWGAFKGSSTLTGLAFEDGAGTLRFLNNIPCNGIPAVTLEIRRTVGNTSDGGNQ
jgi:hypothetical protein